MKSSRAPRFDAGRASFTILATALLLGCGVQEEEGSMESRESLVSLAPPAGEGLSLAGFALRPTVRAGDSVIVGFVIRNGGSTRRLVLDPRFFEVRLIGPDSRLVARNAESWTGSTGDESVVFLPHLGMVGRLFVLPCGNPGFSAVNTCDSSVSQLAAGDYKLVLMYLPPPPPESGEEAIRLTSDTIRVRVDLP